MKRSNLSWLGYKPLTHLFNNMKIIRYGYYFGAILAHDATEFAKNTSLQKFPKIDTAIETMGNDQIDALVLFTSQALSVCFFPTTCVSTMWCQIVLGSTCLFASELPFRRTFSRTQWVRHQDNWDKRWFAPSMCHSITNAPQYRGKHRHPKKLVHKIFLRVQRQTAMIISVSAIRHRTNELGWNLLFLHRSTWER